MTLRIKRGLEADRLSYTPPEGEPIYVTDTNRLYIGDGVTAGGTEVIGVPPSGAMDSEAVIRIINENTPNNLDSDWVINAFDKSTVDSEWVEQKVSEYATIVANSNIISTVVSSTPGDSTRTLTSDDSDFEFTILVDSDQSPQVQFLFKPTISTRVVARSWGTYSFSGRDEYGVTADLSPGSSLNLIDLGVNGDISDQTFKLFNIELLYVSNAASPNKRYGRYRIYVQFMDGGDDYSAVLERLLRVVR